MPAKLTTHVLDLARGRPAAGMRVELWRLDPEPRLLKSAATNADGRTDAPLLEGAQMAAGAYEIVFLAGDYFAGNAAPGESAAAGGRFLDRIPVRFSLAEAGASCHVPLLVTPWGYTTYRGS